MRGLSPFRIVIVVSLGGALDGTVTDIGITYVRFSTEGRVMSIPNSQVLNAVVGPQPQPHPPAAVPVSPPEDDQPTPPGRGALPS